MELMCFLNKYFISYESILLKLAYLLCVNKAEHLTLPYASITSITLYSSRNHQEFQTGNVEEKYSKLFKITF